MPESTVKQVAKSPRSSRRDWLVRLGLIAALLVILGSSLVLAPAPKPGGEAFQGADATVTGILEEQGVEPWFTPIFEPGSAELESGLFAVQAAFGAGILGFCLGSLRLRSSKPESSPETPAAD